MKQVYYSELLKKYYDDKEKCLAAEDEYTKKHEAELKAKEERVTKAKEVEEAYKHYLELRSEFVKKYGSYHMTFTDKDLAGVSIFDLFEPFIRF